MKGKTEEREHALLSASSAKKWMNCPASARLEEQIPDEESAYAAEGSLAHAICELKLTKKFIDRNMTDRTYKSRMNKLTKNELYQKEMDGFTDRYVEYVTELAFGCPQAPFMAVEKRLDYSDWAPEGFGTGDCILLSGDHLHIIDFKYGKGVPVSAVENPQMKCYGLGALKEFGMIYPIRFLTLHIVQPRIDNGTSQWEVSREELEEWGKNALKPAAEEAYRGDGPCRPGEWCDAGFCKLRATCRARAQQFMELMDTAQNLDPDRETPSIMVLPPALTDEEVGEVLKKGEFLESWIKKLKEYATKAITEGKNIPGWKLVEGRSNRIITDQDKAFAELMLAGYSDAVLYNRVPITLTELEKTITKEHREEILGKYIVKPQGKPTLVSEADKRPPMQLQVTAQQAFGGENTYKEDK